MRELSERVFDIVPREKAEAVALAHRYAYLVERRRRFESHLVEGLEAV